MGNASFRLSQQNSINNPAVKRHLQSEGFKEILQALNIKPSDVSNIIKQEGVDSSLQLKNQLQEMTLIEINKDLANTIKMLGLHAQDVVVVLDTTDEIETIRKRFKKLKESTSENKEKVKELLANLEVKLPDNIMVIEDEIGGVYILKKGFDEIQDSIEEA